MKQQWGKVLLKRRVLVILLLLIQIVLIFFLVAGTVRYFRYGFLLLNFLSVLVCIHLFNKNEKAGYRLTWVFLILLFPFFGGIMYILFYFWSNPKKHKKQLAENILNSRQSFYLPGDSLAALTETHPEFKPQAHYLQEYAGFPVYANTKQEYFDSGETFFDRVLQELEKAEHYIFIEFFIMREGIMLDSIIAILEKKASAGLDVRVMYDDLGCFMSLPPDYKTNLEKKGIKCFIFNPFRPIVSSLQNNRDHRKIIAIDGRVAFTGGPNLADEYINAVERFGHWKDAAIMLNGDGAWSLTLIFLQMWNLQYKSGNEDYASFYPGVVRNACIASGWGFVQPYADNPMNDDNVGENVYIQIINTAKKYVYITTPYLVIDDNLLSALTLAAKSGVDVRIITPHRWDKWIMAITSRSYYRRLISAGVKIHEYTAGFNHSKTFVSDDKIATVGTINLDFRSLYLHYECGVLIYCSPAIEAIKNDFWRILPASHEISLKECSRSAFQRVIADILRVFAPLM